MVLDQQNENNIIKFKGIREIQCFEINQRPKYLQTDKFREENLEDESNSFHTKIKKVLFPIKEDDTEYVSKE